MEGLVKEMQDTEHGGVPVRSQKLFLTSIPAAFMGKYNKYNCLVVFLFSRKSFYVHLQFYSKHILVYDFTTKCQKCSS